MEYTMDNLVDSGRVPMSIAENLLWRCIDPGCKSPILYSENLRHARCANMYCPQHMSQKIAQIFATLQMKGLGPAFAERLVKSLKLTAPIQALDLSRILQFNDKSSSNYKLLVGYLQSNITIDYWKFYTFLFVPGIKDEWMNIVATAKTSEEVAKRQRPHLVQPEVWEEALKSYPTIDKIVPYFNVIYRNSNKIIEVTLTGSIRNYSNRDDYITVMNQRYGDTYTIKQVGKKKSANFLVTDSDMRGHSKMQTAIEAGIPILSSEQFEELLKSNNIDAFIYLYKQHKLK